MKKFLQNKYVSIIWTAARIWIGWHWLEAGWHKLTELSGAEPFGATGFLKFVTLPNVIPEGAANVTKWYGWLAANVFIPMGGVMTFLIIAGEILVGIALIVGIFTRFSLGVAFFMNMNFMLAGTLGKSGSNPEMVLITVILLGLGAAVYTWGVDRWFLPVWKKWMAKLFKKKAAAA